jgi:hypothetical protein
LGYPGLSLGRCAFPRFWLTLPAGRAPRVSGKFSKAQRAAINERWKDASDFRAEARDFCLRSQDEAEGASNQRSGWGANSSSAADGRHSPLPFSVSGKIRSKLSLFSGTSLSLELACRPRSKPLSHRQRLSKDGTSLTGTYPPRNERGELRGAEVGSKWETTGGQRHGKPVFFSCTSPAPGCRDEHLETITNLPPPFPPRPPQPTPSSHHSGSLLGRKRNVCVRFVCKSAG